MLTESQKQRYLRNTILPEIGENGQEKLLQAKVLVVGAGGLGAVADVADGQFAVALLG